MITSRVLYRANAFQSNKIYAKIHFYFDVTWEFLFNLLVVCRRKCTRRQTDNECLPRWRRRRKLPSFSKSLGWLRLLCLEAGLCSWCDIFAFILIIFPWRNKNFSVSTLLIIYVESALINWIQDREFFLVFIFWPFKCKNDTIFLRKFFLNKSGSKNHFRNIHFKYQNCQSDSSYLNFFLIALLDK